MKSISILALLLVCSGVFAQGGFVQGDILLFEDHLANDKVGARPVKWKIEHGNVSVAQVNGEKAISFTGASSVISALMSAPLKHLPECLLTIEFDFYTSRSADGAASSAHYSIVWDDPGSGGVMHRTFNIQMSGNAYAKSQITARWLLASTGKDGVSTATVDLSRVGWYHAALSFNRGVMNIYIDGKPVMSEKDVQQPVFFEIHSCRDGYIRNLRIGSDHPPFTAAELAEKLKFVPGSQVIFEDKFLNEKVGAAPSKWSFQIGKAEIGRLNNENVLSFKDLAIITPVVDSPKNYLPENYTVELEFYASRNNTGSLSFLMREANKEEPALSFTFSDAAEKGKVMGINWRRSDRNPRNTVVNFDLSEGWHRLAISYHKRVLNIYMDEKIIFNAGSVLQAGWFSAVVSSEGSYLRNVRIAK